ncbi:MAG: sigma-70 family RNA polymerase sigma factor [Acidobacteriota bacterium]
MLPSPHPPNGTDDPGSDEHLVARGLDGTVATTDTPSDEPFADDAALACAYLAGHAGAWATVDGWITGAVRSYAQRLGNDWEDVCQEARLDVHRLLETKQFRGTSSLRTYVWSVATHRAIDLLRRRQRRPALELDGLLDTWHDQLGALRAPTPRYGDRHLIEKVLRALPAKGRRLLMYLAAGHSYRELSALFDTSEGALRVQARRSRQRALEIRARLLSRPATIDPTPGAAKTADGRALAPTHRTERLDPDPS